MIGDVRAWLVWFSAAAALTLVARNPTYLLLLLLSARLMAATYGLRDRSWAFPFWGLGAFVLGIAALYSMAFVHEGETVLFRLPPWPLVGGPWTAEALAAGVVNGLVLLVLMAVFLALGSVVRTDELLRLVPAGLRDLGLVLLIAVNYVPETRLQLRLIQEAQAIRGHRLRGLAEWRPVVIPLLESGLERAVRLAEAMVARGFGSAESTGRSGRGRLALLCGLLLAMAGWLLLLVGRPIGWVGLGAGLGVLLAVVWRSGRRHRRTQYRVRAWSRFDTLLVTSGVAPVILLILGRALHPGYTLAYDPFPRLGWPPFDPVVGLTLAVMALPAAAQAITRPADAPERLT
jgi:energy-coupling factor transport system permease protein